MCFAITCVLDYHVCCSQAFSGSAAQQEFWCHGERFMSHYSHSANPTDLTDLNPFASFFCHIPMYVNKHTIRTASSK